MTEFLDRFRPDPDPDIASVRRVWTAEKPLLREAVVTYAPPYPEYPELELESDEEPSSDPSCPSARDVSHEIEVAMYSNNGNGFGDYHERAWNFIIANADAIEAGLRRKLFARHRKSLKQFLEEDLPGYEEAEDYWRQIEDKIDWNAPSAIDDLYKLVGIGFLDSGLDDCGFSSFEFQTGWDRDHGISILMHKADVLIAGGMSEYTTGGDLIQAIKIVQEYDLDDGDFSLLEA